MVMETDKWHLLVSIVLKTVVFLICRMMNGVDWSTGLEFKSGVNKFTIYV